MGGAEALAPVPPCKGCGSTNLRTLAQATVPAIYSEPLGVNGDGDLVFRYSDAGYGENERWTTHCLDCGRRVRRPLPPVEGSDY